MSRISLTVALLLLGSLESAHAQPVPAPLPDSPATGPAQLIGRGSAAGAQERVERATEAAESAPQADTTQDEETRQRAQRALAQPEVATSQTDESLPAGTIRVEVTDPNGRPVASAAVRIGVMVQGGDRDAISGQTNAEGVFEKADLPTGSSQAYRVTVPVEGAVYGATPFRLDPSHGQRVRVRRMGTTTDDASLLMVMGQTVLELREGRLHVVQQSQISNLGAETYVFPSGGLPVQLPAGFTAFQSQAMMSDQRLIPNDDGFSLQGSMPSGSVSLAWAYDLPISGRSMTFRVALPFRTARYRVISSAAPGLRLRVTGFPPAQAQDARGESFLVTELQRSPSDPPLRTFTVTVSGIPGPGPQRMIALGAAGLLLFIALIFVFRPGDRRKAEAAVLDARRLEILAEVKELERLRSASEVGPKYHERRLRQLTTELARVLQLQERQAAVDAPATAA
ncbi:MAG: carboxypeptidase regulatory-like domain-containing protein [Deltaproteobacteria bacterium]|nr:carboxypeptidase regulatory-like domain-containing protein [Deltaproteobacteria bacterium]